MQFRNLKLALMTEHVQRVYRKEARRKVAQGEGRWPDREQQV